ncbi:MAG TPA: HAMP domain-containing sensor histidine kinase [Polyangiaceae bacterium]|nr:HAMP domain-containing sensor histidine kinase [Polyangiaceae bacterium]
MAHATSTSARALPVINHNCALRRNVRVQPYGRCSVCSLHLPQCLAWQSSAFSFFIVIFALVPLVVSELWVVRLSVAVVLGLLVLQGMLHHKRTDELILGQHRLKRLSEGLEKEVDARTAKLREANAALAKANLELEDLAREREKMVLDVSHDLRTPMTSVKGAAQNLLDGIAGALTDAQRDYVEIVHEHAGRLVNAVSELLERARRSGAGVELTPATIDMAELTQDVLRGLQPIADQKGVRVVFQGPALKCAADAEKLRKVVENLVGNAIKFTERSGEVRVALEQRPGEVRLMVKDTGIGMDESELSRVFERFYRASPQPGTGLGLAIARDLVRLHRGEITVSSQRGVGTEFAVSLPESPR